MAYDCLLNYITGGGTDVVPLSEQIPEGTHLARRPTRDERLDELMELRTEDGHVIAVVEEIPLSYRN